jgi:hypothetical protein
MQSLTYKKFLTLSSTLVLAISFNLHAAQAPATPTQLTLADIHFPKISELTAKQATVGALILVTIAAIWSYRHKTTQPKRVYPRDNSASEILSYVWNEIIVGQEEKPRVAKRVELDLENPTVFNIEYEGVDPRGIVGITHSYAKDVIVPTLTAILVFNTYKQDILKAINELSNIMTSPAVIAEVAKEAAK